MSTFRMNRFDKALHPDVKRGEAGAAWIKSFTGQLEDPEYLMLTSAERGLLHDLRLLAARRKNALPLDPERLAAMVRANKSASRVAPMIDKLARLDFVSRTDGAEWIALHRPQPRLAREKQVAATHDNSEQVATDHGSSETASAAEVPANEESMQAEHLHDADAEEREIRVDNKNQENGSSTSWPSAVGDIPRIGASGVLDDLVRRRTG